MKIRTLKSMAPIALAGLTALSALAADAPNTNGWKNESQAGIVMTSGNTDTSTLSFGETASYQFTENLVKITGAYLYQKSGDVLSGKSWNLGVRYERILSEKFGVFAGETVEGNRFAGVNQRYSTDLGGKYTFVKDDTLTWFGEAGYRYTKENLTLLERKLHYARVYTEIEKKFTPTFSGKYWLEYLPNFTDSDDWQLNTEASVSAAISSLFSLKSAYLLKFDHQINAPGLVKTDKTFTTSLVAKF
jgi:putative salt-induced outer membrane protein